MSTYLDKCHESAEPATRRPLKANVLAHAQQPSKPTVASEISAIPAPPAASPLVTRQRRPTRSSAAGNATRVGLKRQKERISPARNCHSFSRHQRNSAQIKKTTAAI